MGKGEIDMTELSEFDKSLLNKLQGNLPICSHPFAALAEQLGTDEDTVLSRVRDLKKAGYLRRVGIFFDSDRLGYQGTLVALQVEPDRIQPVAEAINRYPGATHNYEREGEYNLWFTLLTPDREREQSILSDIRNLPGVDDMLNLKMSKKYKVNVQFQLR